MNLCTDVVVAISRGGYETVIADGFGRLCRERL